MAIDLATLIELRKQLGFYNAGGGQRSEGQQIGEALGNVGKGLSAAGTGIGEGADIYGKFIKNSKDQADVDKLLQESSPVGEYLNIPSASQESVLHDIFNQQEDQRKKDVVGKMLGLTGTMQDTVKNTPEIEQVESQLATKTFQSPRESFQNNSGVSPETPLNVYDKIQEARLKQAQANYYNSGQKGGTKLYVDVNPKSPTFRSVSETKQPGFIEVSSNTGAGIATQPGKEDVVEQRMKEMQKSSQDFQRSMMEDRKSEKKALEEQKRQDRLDKGVLAYGKEIDNDPVLKKLSEQSISLDTANQLSDLAKSGNTVAAAALGMKEARGLGEVGVVTEQDVKRYVISGQLARKAGDTLLKWINGKPSEATLDEIVAINDVIKDSLRKKVQPIYNKKIVRFSRNMGVTPEEASFQLNIPYVELLSDYLSRKDVPDDIKAMAAVAKGKGFDEDTILNSLKETLASRTKKP